MGTRQVLETHSSRVATLFFSQNLLRKIGMRGDMLMIELGRDSEEGRERQRKNDEM
jgi:hypothetical protein